MRRIRFLLIYIACSAISAQASTSDYAQSLLKAKSANEIRALQKIHEDFLIAHRACKLQLDERSAPLACYDSLNLEIKSGLHPDRSQQHALRAKLDRLCDEAAQRLQIPRKFPTTISSKCRISLVQADRVRKYRESRPDWSEN